MNLRVDGQTTWLTQAGIAELFQTTPQNVTTHVRSIYDDGELAEAATCKKSLRVRPEGGRRVAERVEADAEDLRQVEALERKLKRTKNKPTDGEK